MLRIPDKEQAKLTDYNLVIEKHNQGLEPADVDYEWNGFSIGFSFPVLMPAVRLHWLLLVLKSEKVKNWRNSTNRNQKVFETFLKIEINLSKSSKKSKNKFKLKSMRHKIF